ncbi:interferon gamma receptor 2 isoform X2 [Echeneis naucrates]|uniref:interferon gamma receptor 2 isoform X2 n=1 Tax=Echeneis naucrates TaxID=173247 RepID=UPI0011139DA2|nr:interferon alpha/beta receptor 1-like isoform X2 [Echeneis naucrates]
MFLILLWIPAFVSVPALSQAPPPPPQNIHVDKWLLMWAPASQESNITYTVEYQSFDPGKWKGVPTCIREAITSCNVAVSKAESVNGCVMLRVRAERDGLSSIPVQACSRHGHSCSPEVSLTVRPQSMTVYLSRNHSLVQEHASQVKYRVYYGKAGELLTKSLDAASSVSIPKLEEGQRA